MKRLFKNVLFIKCGLTLLLIWCCYVPEIRLDMKSMYVQEGKLLYTGSRRSYDLFNGKRLSSSMDLFGCSHGIYHNDVLDQVDDGKTLLELVFVRNLGHSLSKCDLVVEIRKEGKTLRGYTQKEMIDHMSSLSTRYLGSIIVFSMMLPVIWFPKFFSYFTSRKPA